MSIPTPPAGYQPSISFEYPKRPLQIIGTTLALLLIPLLMRAIWSLHDGFPAGLFDRGLSGTVVMIGSIAGAIVIHELVHGVAYRILGYQVSYGVNWRLMAAYAAAFGQFQKRNHNLIVALAPLLALTPLFAGLMASNNSIVILIGFTALLFNTSGAIGDLYLTQRLLRLPAASLLYDVDPATMLIYLPLNETAVS